MAILALSKDKTFVLYKKVCSAIL